MTRGLNTLKNILALLIKTCFGASSVCHTHTHTHRVMERSVSGFNVMGCLLQRGLYQWGRWDVWPWETQPLKMSHHMRLLSRTHTLDAFGRVRLSTLMYALPFTLQPFRSDSRGTSKWHVCMKHKNTAPPLNNCGELVMMTSALTAPEGGRGASVFAFGRCTLASRGRLLYRLSSQRFLKFLLLFSKF